MRYLYPEFPFMKNLIFIGVTFLYAIYFWESLAFVNKKLYKYYSFEKGIGNRLTLQIIFSMLIVLPVQVLVMGFFLWFIPEQLDQLLIVAVKLEEFIFISTFLVNLILIIAIVLGYFGVYYFKQWKKTIIQSERLAKEKALMQKEWASVQFTNLQNQLNPHFFFNSITSLQSLIYENQELAAQFLQQLSKVYRYILQNKSSNLVSIATELSFIEQYVYLLKTRFQSCLEINIDIDKSAVQHKIVPVTLQVLIENAIKHNRMTDEEPLRLNIISNGRYLIIENNKQLKRQIENSNKVGLENMKLLYNYLSETKLVVEDLEHKFSVKVPLLN